MRKKPVLENHYGVDVWTNKPMDELRKTECMCRFCDKLVPGDAERNCPLAQRLYDVCREGVALAVTRCKDFSEKQP